MQEIALAFDRGNMKVALERRRLLGIVHANELPPVGNEIGAVERSLANSIGKLRLSALVDSSSRVAVLVSDLTRPTPSRLLLPPILKTLEEHGVPHGNVTLVFGLGFHRSLLREEQEELVGKVIAERYKCINSPDEGFVALGTTKRGTRVEFAKSVVEATLCICTGNVELHYFAGYTGGAKAIMPAAASIEAITHNHSFCLQPNAVAGRCEGNPVREDLEEAVDFLPNVFVVNAVLNEGKKIVACMAGDFRLAHREACKVVDQMYKVPVSERADVVLASAGGFPKDLNIYQAQKALENASHAVKTGGVIVLVAACNEGLGNHVFAQWVREGHAPRDWIERLEKGFVLGGHKAAAIARVLSKAKVFLVSNLDRSTVESLYFMPFTSAEQAVKAGLATTRRDAEILVMPFAGSTLPSLEN